MCALAIDEIETFDDPSSTFFADAKTTNTTSVLSIGLSIAGCARADAPSRDLFADLILTETCARRPCESSTCDRRPAPAHSVPTRRARSFDVRPAELRRCRRVSVVLRRHVQASHARHTDGLTGVDEDL